MVDCKKQIITSSYGPRKDGFHHGVDLRSYDLTLYKPLAIIFPERCRVLRIWHDGWGGGLAVKPLETDFDELKFIHVGIRPDIIVDGEYEQGHIIGYTMLGQLNKKHHLHFESLRVGKSVDPIEYFKVRGADYE